jgi:hypothetical protein
MNLASVVLMKLFLSQERKPVYSGGDGGDECESGRQRTGERGGGKGDREEEGLSW